MNVILLLVSALPGLCGHIVGNLVIGEQKYSIDGSISQNGENIMIDFTVQRAGKIISHIKVTMGPIGDHFDFNGLRYSLDARNARAWRHQISSEFTDMLGEYDFVQTKEGNSVIFESKSLVEMRRFLPGKIRLTYQLPTGIIDSADMDVGKVGKLVSIRFFSLSEWNNCFHDYIALSLDFL